MFYAGLVTSLVMLVFTFFIPESNKHLAVHTQESTPTLLQQINILSAIRVLFHVKQTHANRYAVLATATTIFLITILLMPPLMLYGMLMWNWTAYEGSILVSGISISRLLVMTLVLPLLSRIFLKETASQHKFLNFNLWLVRVGTLTETLEMVFFGLATSTAQAFTAALFGSLAVLAHPSLRAILTILVHPRDVGKVLGAVAVADSFGSKFVFFLSFSYNWF